MKEMPLEPSVPAGHHFRRNMAYPRIIVYQYPLKANREEDILLWDLPEKDITDLYLGFSWQDPVNVYNKRQKFYWSFSFSRHADEMYSIIEGSLETHKPSLNSPTLMMEMSVMPEKLDADQRGRLGEVINKYLHDPKFKIWWEDDPRGARKRNFKIKRKMLEAINKLKDYDGSDDLSLEDVEVGVPEALEFFEYTAKSKARDVKPDFQNKLNKLTLKHHPDAETGNESAFLYLQKCRNVLERFIKR